VLQKEKKRHINVINTNVIIVVNIIIVIIINMNVIHLQVVIAIVLVVIIIKHMIVIREENMITNIQDIPIMIVNPQKKKIIIVFQNIQMKIQQIILMVFKIELLSI